jgi:hypothetical protein
MTILSINSEGVELLRVRMRFDDLPRAAPTYASEADLLNVALFGKTAAQ